MDLSWRSFEGEDRSERPSLRTSVLRRQGKCPLPLQEPVMGVFILLSIFKLYLIFGFSEGCI